MVLAYEQMQADLPVRMALEQTLVYSNDYNN